MRFFWLDCSHGLSPFLAASPSGQLIIGSLNMPKGVGYGKKKKMKRKPKK
tara:strand:- start:640 stop:789 length:150 start_codon:yes stop_codon:yes gene_type:complete